MEELFQILIILFFIAVSIASSMKKKKQQQQKKSVKPSPNTLESSKNIHATDIFGFKIETPNGETQIKSDNYDSEHADTFDEHESWNPEKEFSNEKIDSEDDFKQKAEAIKSYYQSTKKQLKAFDKNVPIDSFEVNPSNKFQKLLLKPSNVQEYLIVAEILNKPKALRR